jgi:hypothetical protein
VPTEETAAQQHRFDTIVHWRAQQPMRLQDASSRLFAASPQFDCVVQLVCSCLIVRILPHPKPASLRCRCL